MKTLVDVGEIQQLTARIPRLDAGHKPDWGSMNAGGMIRHLLDSFEMVMGQRPAADVSSWVSRSLLKYLALKVPIAWPKDYPTRPEADQKLGGTKPGDFEVEREKLISVLQQFSATPRDFEFGRHPVFAELSAWEWMRWGWLHVDHHLRQFGV
ncbi:MAG: DUF1569 domain-containing protein [Acidobacteria bacterium]|nr:DUF1569 domain-containing protein [Acidobacteriota bacterium]